MGIEGNSRIAIVLITVIVISSIGLVLLLNTGPQTLEWRYGENDTRREVDVIKIGAIVDTTLTISFVDDPGLVARVTYELHSDNTAPMNIIDDYVGLLELYGGSGNDRVKTLAIVLGIERPYNILIRGTNLTASVTYDNGANVHMAYIDFDSSSSSIDFTITEDIQFNSVSGFFDVDIEADSADIHIALPDGLDGSFSYPLSSLLDLLHSEGWTSTGFGSYRTSSYEFPRLEMSVDADPIQAWLGA